MAEEVMPLPPATEAAAVEKKDDKHAAEAAAVKEVAHASVELEAKAHEEAERIAEVAGERAAKKFLDAAMAEIEGKLQTWLDERLKQIHAKPAEKTPEEVAAAAAAEPVAHAAQTEEKREPAPGAEAKKRRLRFI